MVSWRQRVPNVGALGLALTAASLSSPQSGNAAEQSGIVIFWDATKCGGGYETNSYSVHCEPGPFGAVLDFKTKMQFFASTTRLSTYDGRFRLTPNLAPPSRRARSLGVRNVG